MCTVVASFPFVGFFDRGRAKRTPEDAFADELARMVPLLVPVQSVERGDDFSLKLVMKDGKPAVLFLQNIFAEASRLDGEGREERLRRAVLALAPSGRPQTWDEAKPRLMPALRAASWAAALSHGARSSPLRRVFSPFLLSLVAIDDEHGMSFVTEDDAREWAVEWADVLSAAVANLLRTTVPVGAPRDSPCLDVLGPDGYVSSWLVAPQALKQFGEPLGSDFVAVAKSRDALRLIAIGDRDFLVTELERLLAEYLSEPRQLSPVPFIVQNGETAPWDPPKNDLCRPIVDRLQHMLALREYDLQLTVLDDLFTKSGDDVFVARYSLMEREDKSVWSWASWAKQVSQALLPRTDYLCLSDLDTKANLWVRWDDAERVTGEALQEERGYYPARWRVRGWPDERVVAKLGQLAVSPGSDQRTQ